MPVCSTCGTDNAAEAIMCCRCGARLPGVDLSDAGIAEKLLDQAFKYSDEGRLEEAIASAEQAVAANSQSTSAHSLLGILYERAGQRQRAISQYEQALNISPRSSADREALRQLMARPRAHPRPGSKRAAIVGAFVVACAFLVAGIGVVLQSGTSRKPPFTPLQPTGTPPSTAPRTATAPPARTAAPAARPAAASTVIAAAPATPQRAITAPAPYIPPSAAAPAPPTLYRPPVTAAPAPVAAPALPSRYPATYQTAPIAPPPSLTRPDQNVPVNRGPVVPSAQAARAYYFERDYPKAVDTYERYLRTNGDSQARVHAELAWCYYQVNRPQDAVSEYSRALARYRQEANDPETRDEAVHGIRSCQAALAALQSY